MWHILKKTGWLQHKRSTARPCGNGAGIGVGLSSAGLQRPYRRTPQREIPEQLYHQQTHTHTEQTFRNMSRQGSSSMCVLFVFFFLNILNWFPRTSHRTEYLIIRLRARLLKSIFNCCARRKHILYFWAMNIMYCVFVHCDLQRHTVARVGGLGNETPRGLTGWFDWSRKSSTIEFWATIWHN